MLHASRSTTVRQTHTREALTKTNKKWFSSLFARACRFHLSVRLNANVRINCVLSIGITVLIHHRLHIHGIRLMNFA